MKNKFSSSVAGASIFIALYGVISKGLGFFREVLFAGIYGLSTDFDIYLIGSILPLTINTIILCIGQNYLIPSYNRIKKDDVDLARNFIQKNFYLFIFIGLLISLILFVFSGTIISLYLSDSNPTIYRNALNIYNLFLISIPFTSAISVIIASLQSNFEFRYSVASNILPNIVVLFFVYFFRSLDIFAIPIGFVIGTFLQMIFLLINSEVVLFDYPILSTSFKKNNDFTSIALIFIILIETIGQFYVVADRYFYHMVFSGGISALNYAQTILLLPLSIISLALSTALFPKFSQLLHQNLYLELERVFNNAIKVSIIIFIPIMFLFIFYGDTIVAIIFERGKFSSSDTMLTSRVLFYFSLSMVFYVVYGIINKIIYSAGLIDRLLYISIIGISIKILLNYFLVQRIGQNGLALSTSISYCFFFFSSIILVYKRFPFKNKNIFFPELLYQLINCMISYIIAKQILIFNTFSYPNPLYEIIIFLIVFIINIVLLKNSFIKIIFQLIKNFNLAK